MDGDIVSPTPKESLDVEGGGKIGFLEDDEWVILKKSSTLQTPSIQWKKGSKENQRGVEKKHGKPLFEEPMAAQKLDWTVL